MKRISVTGALAAIAASSACAAPPAPVEGVSASHAQTHAGAACGVEFVQLDGQSLLELWAGPGLAGGYEVDIRQISRSGDATISQSGSFASGAYASARISQIALGGSPIHRGASLSEMMASVRNAEPGTTVISSDGSGFYEVRMRLLDEHGRVICFAERHGA